MVNALELHSEEPKVQLPVAGLLRRLASTGGLMRAELVGAGVLPPLCCALVRYVQRARCSATTDEMLNVVAEICKTQNRTRVAAGCTEISRANRMAGELAAQLARAGQTTSSSRRRLCESLERTGVLSAALQALQVLALAPFLCCRSCMWQGMWISKCGFLLQVYPTEKLVAVPCCCLLHAYFEVRSC